ncbi:tetratricopeptide repeat protein [Nocardioides sp. P5_C9_2]
MAEDRRSQRPTRSGGKPPARGGSSGGSTGRGGKGYSGGESSSRGGRPAAGGRPAQSRQGDSRSGDSRSSDSRGSGDRKPRQSDWKRPREEQGPRTVAQAEYDGPPLPEEITGKELDRAIAAQLKGLPEKLAARVARHLAAAGSLIDTDPETAYQHTLAARARASRIAIVREAVGESAYAAGHYAEALSELRAAKRMNGATDYLPIMADCHRALGQPEQALKLAKSPSVANFSSDAKAEMTLVEAGARRDMGQLDAALRTLELAPLQSKSRESWVVRLRYAYADTLEAAGRESDALAWFHRTHAVDSNEITDSAARAELLEKRMD